MTYVPHRARHEAFRVGQKNWDYWLKMLGIMRGARTFLWFFNRAMFSARNFASKFVKMEFCVVILTNFEKVLLQPFTTTKFGR